MTSRAVRARPGCPDRRIGFILSAITAIQVLASFGLQWYVVSHFGAGAKADAFYAAGTLPQIISVLFIDTLPLIIIPMLSSVGCDQLNRDVWQVLVVAISALLMVSGVLSVIAGPLVGALVPGFSVSTKNLTAQLTRIQLIGLPGAGATAVLTGVAQVRGHFVWPPVAALTSNLTALWVLIAYLKSGGIPVAAWAQVIAAGGPALLLLPVAGVPRFFGWSRSRIRELWRLLLPIVLGKAYYLTSAPVDRLLTSFLPPGTLMTFEIVGRFYSAVQRILLQGILVPFLPQQARLASVGDWQGFKELYYKASRLTLMFSTLVVLATEFGVLWVLPNIPRLPGAIQMSELNRIAMIIALMGAVLPGTTLLNVSTNAFYSQGDTYTPTKLGAIAYTAGLAFRLGGFYVAGIRGIAVATSAWIVLHCVLLHIVLSRRTTKLIDNRSPSISAVAESALN